MQDILGCDMNSSNCHITVIDVGWYSQKHWNRSSWKAGHSRMIWALSSLASWQRRHCESTAGSTFDLWYFRKLWPVRCLMHNPRSFRLKRTSSLESLGFGSGKNIFVCLQWPELSHLDFHFSMLVFELKIWFHSVEEGERVPVLPLANLMRLWLVCRLAHFRGVLGVLVSTGCTHACHGLACSMLWQH